MERGDARTFLEVTRNAELFAVSLFLATSGVRRGEPKSGFDQRSATCWTVLVRDDVFYRVR
jgi:hypothetical protein